MTTTIMVAARFAMWLQGLALLASAARPPSEEHGEASLLPQSPAAKGFKAVASLAGGSFVQTDQTVGSLVNMNAESPNAYETNTVTASVEKEPCLAKIKEDGSGSCCANPAVGAGLVDSSPGCDCKCGEPETRLETIASPHVEQDQARSQNGPSVEELALDERTDIARNGGVLRDLKHQFQDVNDYFKKAALKVWVNGDERTGNNFIKKVGLDWMNKVQEFKIYAGEMRKEAEDVYEDIITSHNQAASKQLSTYHEAAEEKLNDRIQAHQHVAEHAAQVANVGHEHVSSYDDEGALQLHHHDPHIS